MKLPFRRGPRPVSKILGQLNSIVSELRLNADKHARIADDLRLKSDAAGAESMHATNVANKIGALLTK